MADCIGEKSLPPDWLAMRVDPALVVCRVLLLGVAAAAVGWWWVMPHGFPIGHCRFWVNEALPLPVAAWALVGACTLRIRERWGELVLLSVLAAESSLLLTAVVLFPLSARRFVLPAIIALFGQWWCRSARWSGVPKLGRRQRLTALLGGAVAGAGLAWSQQSPPAQTRLLAEPFSPPAMSSPDQPAPSGPWQLAPAAHVRPSDGETTFRTSGLTIEVRALLTFDSCSPDRCWTNLAPHDRRRGQAPRLLNGAFDGHVAQLHYVGDADQWLQLAAGDRDDTWNLDTRSTLAEPIYSHLNSCCEIGVRGHRKLALRFSPCPETDIAVRMWEYPVGLPARLAYLDASGEFCVVEGSSGEKGPFRLLAKGPLARDTPLTLTLLDDGRPAATLRFDDWAAHASTQLSTTAGWGVPVNAIEFNLLNEGETSPATIWMTWAATSVGRGWDSVGHVAGSYRSRLRIELLDVAGPASARQPSTDD